MQEDHDRVNLRSQQQYAYNLMREYNKELKAKGYIVVAGKISTKFLAEKIYGMKVED